MERLQVQKLRLQNEKELKCTKIEINAKDSNQQNNGQRATDKATIKLPKLELIKFDHNLLKWQEFWDSFDTTVNRNPSLEDIDKLNYFVHNFVAKQRCHCWIRSHKCKLHYGS